MTELKRSECSILSLVLKRKWYEMIERGEKREEYRLPTPYWRKRLNNWDKAFNSQTTPVVEFRLGYARRAPRMAFWCFGIETVRGLMPYAYVDTTSLKHLHPEWGEPVEPHFYISLGGRVELTDCESEVPHAL